MGSERQVGCAEVRTLFTPEDRGDLRSYVEERGLGCGIDPQGVKKATSAGLV